MGQTGQVPRASQGGSYQMGQGSQRRPHPGGGLGNKPKEEERLICKEHGSYCRQSIRPTPEGCSGHTAVGDPVGGKGSL